ncbi:hypothetical protein [Propioniferax innocua]|nr:hypothetical protein [Propioniferax innocua]
MPNGILGMEGLLMLGGIARVFIVLFCSACAGDGGSCHSRNVT